MKDLKILLENYSDFDNESKFASISEDIWRLGSLEEIKKEVSSEAFIFHIAVNIIGNWQCDGWDYIFVECHSMLPYVPETLEELGLIELKNQFNHIVFRLKEYFAKVGIKFLDYEKELDEKVHYDVMNFLINLGFKVEDEKLNDISIDDRKLVSKMYKAEITKLDDISQKLWGYGTEENGWKNILDYIRNI